MPNQGISVSKRVTPAMRLKMQQAITQGGSANAANALIKRWAPKAKHLIPASTDEYEGYNNLLEGVIWGW